MVSKGIFHGLINILEDNLTHYESWLEGRVWGKKHQLGDSCRNIGKSLSEPELRPWK